MAHSSDEARSLAWRLRASARNALELARFGRLAEEHGAPFEVVDRGPHHRLRRYSSAEDAPIALLVPPLMVTADVYDIAPDVSAVAALGRLGIAPWVVDFGAPEREAGGMTRSLDDHVRAVARAIARVRELTRRDVHLCGYSQGGMFAYQTAAWLSGEGIRSIVTFESPVDIHKNLPAVRSDLTGAALRSIFPVAKAALARIEGLPGKLTSTAFKVVSTRKELEQRIEFMRSLHDRERIMRQEARRRFLGGAGFVAWPGPAFRAFVEEFVVHNRMLSGGFVIDGRTVSLADLSCPILAFIGRTDELARPPTVRAIADAAPNADVRFVTVPAGHFGIVVGSRAMEETWPRVAAWIDAIERGKSAREALPGAERDDDDDPSDLDVEIDLFVDLVQRSARGAWRRLGDALASASRTAATVRWQEPRLRRLARIQPDTHLSASRELARRARQTPSATFFLWRGRAFSYADADARVTNVARGLYACGVRPGDRVGVLMGSRPSLLSATTALYRLGAVAVVAPPGAPEEALRDAFERLDVRRVIADPERVEAARSVALHRSDAVEVLVLGGGSREGARSATEGALGRVTELEAIDPRAAPLPPDLELDPGSARDVAHVLLRPSEDETELRAVPVTNHRWALSAIGAAAACTIKPSDTVFCAVPLHHPTGILVSVGSALAGGARLALVELDGPAGAPLDPKKLLLEVRRVGATVLFYTGEMLRPLLDEPPSRADRHLPVRIVAGSGMRPALATRLRERFGVDTMEFYAGTAHRAILADAAGHAPGSLGDVLPGSAEVALVRWDRERMTHALDERGRLVLAEVGEPALLAVLVSEEEIETLGDVHGLVRDAFGDGAAWLVTNDVLERDAAGRHWFADSLAGFVRPASGGDAVSLRRVEDALYALPEVQLAAAWETSRASGEIAAAFVSRVEIAPGRLEEALSTLPASAHPSSSGASPRSRSPKASARKSERCQRSSPQQDLRMDD
jgi:putative long chain acyl-CoA synthase